MLWTDQSNIECLVHAHSSRSHVWQKPEDRIWPEETHGGHMRPSVKTLVLKKWMLAGNGSKGGHEELWSDLLKAQIFTMMCSIKGGGVSVHTQYTLVTETGNQFVGNTQVVSSNRSNTSYWSQGCTYIFNRTKKIISVYLVFQNEWLQSQRSIVLHSIP